VLGHFLLAADISMLALVLKFLEVINENSFSSVVGEVHQRGGSYEPNFWFSNRNFFEVNHF